MCKKIMGISRNDYSFLKVDAQNKIALQQFKIILTSNCSVNYFSLKNPNSFFVEFGIGE